MTFSFKKHILFASAITALASTNAYAIRTTASVEAIESANVVAKATGTINKINFKPGQFVKAGQSLFTIDNKEYTLSVESAKAVLESAKATYDNEKLKFERARDLHKTKSISQQDYDNAVASYASATAALEKAEVGLKTAELNDEYTKVLSPISGSVSDSEVKVGSYVTANSNALLVTIKNIDKVKIKFFFNADYLLRKYGSMDNIVGKKITIKTAFNNKNIEAKVDYVEKSIDKNTGNLSLIAIVDNQNGDLLDNMLVHIIMEDEEDNDKS